jgi:hypothetical protein
MNTGEIIGLVFGIIAIILLILLIVYFYSKYAYAKYHHTYATNNADKIPKTDFDIEEESDNIPKFVPKFVFDVEAESVPKTQTEYELQSMTTPVWLEKEMDDQPFLKS